jgi:hypothetical protein
MDDQTIEKLAEMLGKCATTGDSNELVKFAAPDNSVLPLLLAGGGGAALGGAAGYLGTKKEKNKARNAMYGALTGGLSGAGLRLAANALTSSERPDLGGERGLSSSGGVLGAIHAVTKPVHSLKGVAGFLGGAGLSDKLVGQGAGAGAAKLYDRITGGHARTGELDFAAQKGKLDGNVTLPGRGKGKATTLSVSDALKSIFEHYGPRNNKIPSANTQTGADLNELLRTKSLGTTAKQRAAQLTALESALKAVTSNGRARLPGSFMTDLEKAYSGPRGRNLSARGARGLVDFIGGTAGSLIADPAARFLYNMFDGDYKAGK